MSLGQGFTKTNPKSSITDKWRAVPRWQIITLLVVLFPAGLYLLWRQDRWSTRTKKITTWAASGIWLVVFVLMVIFAPPTVTITSSLASVDAASYQLTGKISPAESEVMVNGERAKVVGDTFSSNVQLKEGDNILKIVIVSGSKRTEKEVKVYRSTKPKVSAQEQAASQKKAQEADAKIKADADIAKKKAEVATEQAKKQASEAKIKAAIVAPAPAPTPTVTVSQKNALNKAKSYISFTGFSRDGLVDQLVFDQFSNADATYGADNVGANWNEQAAKKAKSYMEHSSFSRGGLIDQLQYEKFTLEQANYGANSVGL